MLLNNLLICKLFFIKFNKKIKSMISEKLKKGSLLIAEPSMIGDLSFNRSVILLADHNTNGSVGFIINKPLKYTLNELIPEIKAAFRIYNGGPVEPENLYFIHDIPDLIPNSIEISNGIYWGGEYDTIKNLINNNKINKNNIRFFLGYTGWGENQLNKETEASSWIVAENKYKNKIIGKSASRFWQDKIMELGGEYLIWYNSPKNPYLN
jgi:putative transcriptional regulator